MQLDEGSLFFEPERNATLRRGVVDLSMGYDN
jgi:hypothetical protein